MGAVKSVIIQKQLNLIQLFRYICSLFILTAPKYADKKKEETE